MKTKYSMLRPCNPILRPDYSEVLYHDPRRPDRLPPYVRARVERLLLDAHTAPEDRAIDIYAAIVNEMYWYVLRPDEIARQVLREQWEYNRLPRRISISQAAYILSVLGESGYPIHGNGAPDYHRMEDKCCAPICGIERSEVIWAAAYYWAEFAASGHRYVSFGDCRGYLPRPVQYDEPGTVHPQQRAALTLGPATGKASQYQRMRKHTRLLLLVEPEPVEERLTP